MATWYGSGVYGSGKYKKTQANAAAAIAADAAVSVDAGVVGGGAVSIAGVATVATNAVQTTVVSSLIAANFTVLSVSGNPIRFVESEVAEVASVSVDVARIGGASVSVSAETTVSVLAGFASDVAVDPILCVGMLAAAYNLNVLGGAVSITATSALLSVPGDAIRIVDSELAGVATVATNAEQSSLASVTIAETLEVTILGPTVVITATTGVSCTVFNKWKPITDLSEIWTTVPVLDETWTPLIVPAETWTETTTRS